MRESLAEGAHLLRALALFAAGFLVFLVIRGILVPHGFGELGHFRPGALLDSRARPIAFAGRAACEACHGEVVQARTGSKHAGLNCEACHGPLAAHAEDPTAVHPTLPETRTLCPVCHEQNMAKPAGFPQVAAADHAGEEPCGGCHRPHHPEPE